MAYGRSNHDVIDDVAWPWKVKVVILISLRPVISKTAWDRDSVLTGHLWREALTPSRYHGNPQILDGRLKVQMGRVRTLWGAPVNVERPPEPIAPGNNRVEYRIRFLDGIDSHGCGGLVPQAQGKVEIGDKIFPQPLPLRRYSAI